MDSPRRAHAGRRPQRADDRQPVGTLHEASAARRLMDGLPAAFRDVGLRLLVVADADRGQGVLRHAAPPALFLAALSALPAQPLAHVGHRLQLGRLHDGLRAGVLYHLQRRVRLSHPTRAAQCRPYRRHAARTDALLLRTRHGARDGA